MIRKGFTLTELLILLIIMGIMITLSIPTLTKLDSNYRKLYRAAYYITQINAFKHMTHPFNATFCNSFKDQMNTIGLVNCMYSSYPNNPNFVSTNGMKWYGFNNTFAGSPAQITVSVDVNGNRAPNLDNQDLLKMVIYQSGWVDPETDTVEQGYLAN